MKRILKYFFFFCALATSSSLFCQNENTKWYFGNRCALDFITNPPTPLNNSAMNTDEGCSSIADGAGNLLFYTDGITVYDASHSTMANGTGLNGSFSSAQSAIILKQPGSSTIYYIFTMAVANSATGLCYSIVDMSLAAGMGSVTVKNVSLNSGISQEKLTATKHANGSDYWIMTQELTTSDYKAYLLTAMGINTIAIVSSMGPTSPNVGYIKFAPNGQKFANAFYGSSNTLLYDFNKTTGVLSNSLNLNVSAYGCEFSPDGTKLYASNFSNSSIMQWDLSAGSNTAILASAYTVTNSVTGWAMQLAPNQKIYITAQNTTSIHVINNPNVAGVGCNFVASAQVVGISNFSSHVTRGLPTMIAYHSCPTFTTTHTAPLCSGLNTGTAAITAVTGTLGGVTYTWSNGINTYTTPSVNNLSAGQWSVTLTNTIGCTSQSVFTINQPPAITVNIASSSPTACANNSVTLNANALGGVGGFNYAWQGTANGNTATQSTAGNYVYTVVATDNNTCTASKTIAVNFVANPVLTVTPNHSVCPNGTTALSVTGANTYTWFPNTVVSNSVIVSPTPPTSIYTVTGSYTNNCSTSNTVSVSFYLNPVLNISPNQSICPNASATLNVSGANTYTWLSNNVVSNSVVVTPSAQSIYSVTGTSTLGCESTETTQVSIWQLPTLAFTTYSITCANFGSATVMASGGVGSYNYTWQPTGQTNSVAINLNPNTYTVFVHDVGTGCYTDSTVIFSPLVPLTGNLNHTSSFLCNGATTGTANFSNINGGSPNQNYVWNNGVTTHTNTSPNNLSAGNWSVTVADALTGCQIFSVFTITQPPALTLNVASTDQNICTGYNFTLSANTSGGVGAYSYSWLSAPASGSQFTVTPSIAGVHTFTANAYDYNNCFVSNTINVNVVSPPSLTISLSSPSMCAQAFSGSANTITLTSSGANSYTLQTPNQIANSSSLNPVSELNSQPPYVPAGLTTATLLGSNGVCTISTTANFSVIPNPTVSVNNPTPVICAGQSYTYTSQGASSYTWSSSTPNSTLYTYGNIAITNPSINSVFAVVGGSLGCYSPIVTTSITVNPIPEVFVTPTQTYVCIGNSIELKASGTVGNSYSWLPNKDLDQNTGNSVFSSPQVQQTYTVIASLNNCTNAAVATVSIKPLPTPQIQIIKNGKCVNDSIVLKGSGGMAYQWIAPNGQSLWGFEELRIKANHESFSGNYTLTVYDFYSCSNSKTQSITINPLPTGFVKAEKFEGCVPLCNEYVFVPSKQNTTLMNVSWNMNNKNFSGNNVNYCFNQAGTHSIQANVRDENSCANSIVTHVLVFPQPIADFSYTPTQPIESLDEVQFINTSKNAEKFEWNISVINQTSQEKNTSVLFENTGTYVVALTAQNENQCLDTAIKLIYIQPDFTIFVPNIFTPNGDNLNETFKPIIRGQKEYRFQIFNRWGQKIFETTNVNQGWDGTFKGEECKSDVYVWKITVVSAKEEKVLNGTVTLER